MQRVAYSISDTAERLSIPQDDLVDLLRRQELRSFKIGSRRLVPESEIQDLVERKLAAETSDA